MREDGIVLSATRSGSGKTLITCALLKAMKNRALRVTAFKCGPDYIDPMFHSKVLGVPSGNLDIYFAGEEGVRREYQKHAGEDISVIEGVMGLYDGLGGYTSQASAYHVAQTLSLPVLLLVDAHGMGRSVVAEIKGFLSLDEDQRIGGILLNRMSDGLYPAIKELIEKECRIPVLGYCRTQKEVHLDSRYLGLKLPEEISNLEQEIDRVAVDLEKTVDFEGLFAMARHRRNRAGQDSLEQIAKNNGEVNQQLVINSQKKREDRIRIGVAFDEAFCFYYRENLELLEEKGAELCFFSPLHDSHLPEGISGMILGGGYPELKARELQDNVVLREEIKSVLTKGLPSLAECGGFMYLHDRIQTPDQGEYKMAGVIPGTCFYTGKLVRFGYAEFSDYEGRYRVRGHEFHYYDSENNGEAAKAVKPVTGRSWNCGYIQKGTFWSFAHLYYASCHKLVDDFLEAAKFYSMGSER